MSENNALTVKNYMRSPEIMERFAEAIGEQRAAAYISSVMLAVSQNDYLQKCTPQSIAVSAMRAATLRLSCDPATGQAHLVPFKNKATLIVGYKGMVQMALRTGKYRYLNVYAVKEGQEVTEDWRTGHHNLAGKKTGNTVIGHLLSFALVTGFEKTFYMTVEEIHEHAKKYSKSYGYKDSPWSTNSFEMEQKTLIRLGLGKWGYFDPHDVMAMGQSDEVIDELPEQGEVTITEPVKHTEAELLSGLGYDVDEKTGEILDGQVSEPEAQPAQPVTREQVADDAALAEAKAIWVGDKTLGDHTADELTLIIENKKASETLRKAAAIIVDRMQQPAIL